MIKLYENTAVAILGTGDIEVASGILRSIGLPILRMKQLKNAMELGTDLLNQDVEYEDRTIDLRFHNVESLNIVIDSLITIRDKCFKSE